MSEIRLKLYRGSWCATWREAGRTRRASLGTKDRAAAERLLIDHLRKPRAVTTVAEIYTAYLATGATRRAREVEQHLIREFGSLFPEHVTAERCKTYVEKRRQRVKDGTICAELTYLRAALRWHDKNTPAVVEMPPRPPPSTKSLTRDQFKALLAEARSPHMRLFLVLAVSTGARAGALSELTWDRVDFARGTVRLSSGPATTKGRATVPMTATLRAALEEAFKARTCDYVVEYGGERVCKVRKAFERAAQRAGLPWCTPHVLRHTAAVWMAESRVPMAEIAQYLGHTSVRVTERVYARFSPDYLRGAAAALEV
jgi:integrase